MKNILFWLNRKRMRSAALATMVAGVLIQPLSHARAEGIGLGDIVGTAWTIGDAIVGETTLTPAYSINMWDWTFRARGTNTDMYAHYHVRQSLVTKAYFYTWSFRDRSFSTNGTQPFSVDSVDRVNWHCLNHWPEPEGLLEQGTQTHTILVWLAKVEHTGLWPDHGPWQVWVKTRGRQVPSDCRGIVDPSQRNYWAGASLYESGSETVTIGALSCHLEYPYAMGETWY